MSRAIAGAPHSRPANAAGRRAGPRGRTRKPDGPEHPGTCGPRHRCVAGRLRSGLRSGKRLQPAGDQENIRLVAASDRHPDRRAVLIRIVALHAGPFAERQVGGVHHRRPFMEAREEVKEEIAATPGDRQTAGPARTAKSRLRMTSARRPWRPSRNSRSRGPPAR